MHTAEITAHSVSPISTPAAGQPARQEAPREPAPPPRVRNRRGLAAHRLQRVVTCIESRLAEPLLVEELAGEIHMSPFHFARMFKISTGLAPHAYITQQRMERAKALLATTELPLLEVAGRVGYQTQAHFTGVFHRHVGTTPRIYRLQHRLAAPREA